MAISVSVSNITTTSCYVSVTGLPNNAEGSTDVWNNTKKVSYYFNGVLKHTSETISAGTSSTGFNFRDLSPHTSYTVRVVCTNDSSGGTREGSSSFTTPYTTGAEVDFSVVSSSITASSAKFTVIMEYNPGWALTYYVTGLGATQSGSVPTGAGEFTLTTTGLDENTTYDPYITIKNPDGTNFVSSTEIWKSFKTKMNEYISLSASNITQNSATLSTYTYASSKTMRTIQFYVDGSPLSGDGQQTAYSTGTYSCIVEGLTPSTTYTAKVKATPSGSTSYETSASFTTADPVYQMSLDSKTEYSAKSTIKKLTQEQDQIVKWYYKLSSATAYTYYGYTSVKAGNDESMLEIDVLSSGETYSIKAEVFMGDKSLGSKAITVTTNDMAGAVTLGTAADDLEKNTIKVYLTGLGEATYTRDIKWYYKLHSSSTWIYADKDSISAGAITSSPYFRFQGLKPATSYDIRAEILRNSNLLKNLYLNDTSTKNEDGTSTEDLYINKVTYAPYKSSVGSVEIKVYWEKNKNFEDTNYVYYIQRAIQATNPTYYSWSEWNGEGTAYTRTRYAEGYSLASLPETNKTYLVRVYGTDGLNEVYSRPYTVTLTEPLFSWDTAKVQGQAFNLKASEWTRFCQLLTYDMATEPETLTSLYGQMIKGKGFTASMWNVMKDILKEVRSSYIEDNSLQYLKNNVTAGSTITAKMLNDIAKALRKDATT